MTTPSKVPWEQEPHTSAKHDLYAKYLAKWFPILISSWGGEVTYAEGFAGPGVYTKGEPGSPVIALRVLLEAGLRKQVRRVRLLFVDLDSRCVKLLRQRLEMTTAQVGTTVAGLRDHGIEVEVVQGRCDEKLEPLLDEYEAWSHPLLVVLDTFGASVPASMLSRVADTPAGEVLITMGPSYFTRFAEDEDLTLGDAVFGSPAWRAVADLEKSEKPAWLLETYRRTVQAAGFRYVLDFTLVDRRGQLLFLVFGTTNPKGLTKMKEAMWEVDQVHGVGYRDPRDPQQQTLEIEFEPQTAALQRLILAELARRPGQSATEAELRHFALYETVYKEAQASQVIRDLTQAGQVLYVGEQRPGFAVTVRLP